MVKDLPKSAARDAHLALIQVHEAVSDEFRLLFQQFGLTATQFNVLRILVQGDPEGESCGHIGSHLIHRVPDVTRLVDRMQEHGLLERCRSHNDRRVVNICITQHGRELCETLYEPLAELEDHIMKVLNLEEQAQLDLLLRRILLQFQTQGSA
ncbi:MAG: MarR family transcriptional regulator [Planctomycetes bacterium]|nr:MarR family transcriptional regulator [Planctomycetota bacterium]